MGFNSVLEGFKGNSNNTQFWVYALSCECNPHVRCNSNVYAGTQQGKVWSVQI